jgi:hypothetical protein
MVTLAKRAFIQQPISDERGLGLGLLPVLALVLVVSAVKLLWKRPGQ